MSVWLLGVGNLFSFSRQFFSTHSQCQSSLERHSHHSRNIFKLPSSPPCRPNAYLVGAQIKFSNTITLPKLHYCINGAFSLMHLLDCLYDSVYASICSEHAYVHVCMYECMCRCILYALVCEVRGCDRDFGKHTV